uniref:Uncharacterized protein n=1 Tax=Anguilla anguilla TaxID=7936 RepID=A0A0E9QP46_ANGAN
MLNKQWNSTQLSEDHSLFHCWVFTSHVSQQMCWSTGAFLQN